MSVIRCTILGCGSSGGVPRIGGHWGDCDPTNPRNRRRRCSMLVEKDGPEGTTTVLIDSSPDMREQLLSTGTARLDGVVYTHGHADHTNGLDDLRMVVFNMRQRVRVWADAPTTDSLLSRFSYAFVQPEGSPYPPILDLKAIRGPVTVDGPGGPVTLTPFEVEHGSIPSLGFRIGGLAYLPDVSEMTDEAWKAVTGIDTWVVDCLRRTPHSTHAHLDKTLEWIERAAPRQAILTNMHIDLDHDVLAAETADHIHPAYDGMVLETAD